jgi:hypothetical protein
VTEKREGVRDTAREVCIDEVGGRERGRRAHTRTAREREIEQDSSHIFILLRLREPVLLNSQSEGTAVRMR